MAHASCIKRAKLAPTLWECGHCLNLETLVTGDYDAAHDETKTPHKAAQDQASRAMKACMYNRIARHLKHAKAAHRKTVIVLDGYDLAAFKSLGKCLPATTQVLIPNASEDDSADMRAELTRMPIDMQRQCCLFEEQRVGEFLRARRFEDLGCTVVWLDYCATALSSKHSVVEDVRCAIEVLAKGVRGYVYMTLSTRNSGNFPADRVVEYIERVMPAWTGRTVRTCQEDAYANHMVALGFIVE